MQTETEYAEIRLTRTDKRPLAFTGKQLADSTTKDFNSTRWQNCALFQTERGKFVVSIGNITCWDKERDYLRADAFDSLSDAISHVEEHASRCVEQISKQLREAGMDVSERI